MNGNETATANAMAVKNVSVTRAGTTYLSGGTGTFDIGPDANKLCCGQFGTQRPTVSQLYNIRFTYLGSTFSFQMACSISGQVSCFIGRPTEGEAVPAPDGAES